MDAQSQNGDGLVVPEITPFRVDVQRVDGRAVIMVSGEVDLSTAPILVHEARKLLGDQVTSLAVDLGDVTFLDSSGIHALLSTRRQAIGQGTAFTLGPLGLQPRRVLEITGLTTLFES